MPMQSRRRRGKHLSLGPNCRSRLDVCDDVGRYVFLITGVIINTGHCKINNFASAFVIVVVSG